MPELDLDERAIAEKQAIKLKKEKIVKGITCPACSGELDLREGLRTFNCKYCGTLLTTEGDSGILKFYVPRRLNRDQAIEKTYNWLGRGFSKARGLKTGSKIEDVFLTFIPYWRVRADVVGWVFGQEKRTRRVNNTTQTYYVDVERKIQVPFDQTFAACDISELGVQRVNLTGNELIPVELEQLQKEGMTFNIISSQKEIHDDAKKHFISEARSKTRVDRITFEYLDIVREDIAIVYYPLWVVRYNFQNRTYQVVVDGEDGTICYGKAPGNNLYRAVMGILGVSIGMYAATFFSAFAIGDIETSFIVYIIALIFGIAVMTWGYRKFRYGGEIEEGTGIIKTPKKSRNPLSKITGSGDAPSLLKSAGSVAVTGMVISSILKNIKR